MEIKLATKSDIETIQNLLIEDEDAYRKLAMTGCFKAEENDMWNVMFVAWEFLNSDHREIVGFIKASFHSDPGKVYISGIYVVEKARKQGIGKALMQHLLKFSNQAWTHMFINGVTLDNPASAALFKSCGFENTGTIKKHTWKNKWISSTNWWHEGNI